MNVEIMLKDLQKRNNVLKSQLIHDQLKHGSYSFEHYRKSCLLILNEYKKHGSFFKVSRVVGISQEELMNWYVQGQMGNPKFRGFYLAIRDISNACEEKDEILKEGSIVVEDESDNGIAEGDYLISQYGDGWSYKTYIDGEKIFIISNELETLKDKVRAKHLPLD